MGASSSSPAMASTAEDDDMIMTDVNSSLDVVRANYRLIAANASNNLIQLDGDESKCQDSSSKEEEEEDSVSEEEEKEECQRYWENIEKEKQQRIEEAQQRIIAYEQAEIAEANGKVIAIDNDEDKGQDDAVEPKEGIKKKEGIISSDTLTDEATEHISERLTQMYTLEAAASAGMWAPPSSLAMASSAEEDDMSNHLMGASSSSLAMASTAEEDDIIMTDVKSSSEVVRERVEVAIASNNVIQLDSDDSDCQDSSSEEEVEALEAAASAGSYLCHECNEVPRKKDCLLICSQCPKKFHLSCLENRFHIVPDDLIGDVFVCPRCKRMPPESNSDGDSSEFDDED
jgi:hypothetical protein